MVDAAGDHDLIFGLIALRSGVLTPDQLVAGLNACGPGHLDTLTQALEEQGSLPAATRRMLEPLVREELAAQARPSADSGSSEPSLDDAPPIPFDSVADLSLRERLRALAARVSKVPHAPMGQPAPADSPANGQRFVKTHRHAKGGLGVVYLAKDTELDRDVALKEIKTKLADDRDSRARFLMEAQITGRLEHPGIVPVYGLGKYPDGRPYYAMRFIQGDTLKDAIDHFHAEEVLKRDPGARSLELRKLLRRFLDVCDAIDYAHSRGVLHRDLKPNNIMLGKHGETLVVDWGAAKVLDQPESVAGEKPVETWLHAPVTEHSVETLALPGAAPGTPAYMAPEQAEGRLDLLGPATDIYCLGTTLYYLLTGTAPFADTNVAAMFSKISRGQFARPRKIDRHISRSLEAICLKAMARWPEHRYPSVRALADDIERWLADEPVSAVKETPFTLAWRRFRRNPFVAGAIFFIAIVDAILFDEFGIHLVETTPWHARFSLFYISLIAFGVGCQLGAGAGVLLWLASRVAPLRSRYSVRRFALVGSLVGAVLAWFYLIFFGNHLVMRLLP